MNKDVELNKMRSQIKDFILKIYKKDINGILYYIPNAGVIDGNTKISKKTIQKQLLDKNHYLNKHLFRPLSKKKYRQCKKQKMPSLLVSPWAFYDHYQEDYSLIISRMDKSDDFYSIKLRPNRPENICKFEVWYFIFKKTNSNYKLYSYFFH